MSVLSIPNTFTTGTTIQAAPFNQNFTAVQTAVNNIDNTNIGAAGLFASNLIPTTSGNATFGGLIGYIHAAPSAGITPLTVAGFTGQSVDIFDITATSGGQKLLSVGSTGAVTILGGAGSSLYVSALTATSGVANAAGDIVAQRNASSGAIFLGGATHAGALDYGGTIAQAFTLGGGMLYVGSSGVPGSTASGDVAAQRSTSTGLMWIGGSAAAASIDFNINNANQLTFFRWASGVAVVNCLVTGGTYTTVSDLSLKSNVAPSKHGLDTVRALKPTAFTWTNGGENDLGFIAQDVQSVMPEIVSASKGGLLGIAYNGITAATVSAIQEICDKLKAAGVAGF